MKKQLLFLILISSFFSVKAQFSQGKNLLNNTQGLSYFVIADINGDGKDDIITCSTKDAEIAWFPSMGLGNFDFIKKVISTNSSGISSVWASDMDNDGDVDLISSSWWDNKIAYYQNLGLGNFAQEQIITLNAVRPHRVITSDLDNDGLLDIISGSWDDNKVAWYKNFGNGNFGTQQILTTNADDVQSLVAVDFDNDGDQDIFSISSVDNKLALYENLGAGLFASQQVISTQGISPIALECVDVNNDGYPDLIMCSRNDKKLSWFQNMGNGTFGPQQTITVSASVPKDITCKDIDNDNDIDIVMITNSSEQMVWFENTGLGSFGTSQFIRGFRYSPNKILSQDIDNDGLIDVFVSAPDSVSWIKNNGSGSFGNLNSISTNLNEPRKVIFSDIDNDGDQDVITNDGDQIVCWFENLGGGIFSNLKIITRHPKDANEIAVGDIDNDGDDDIIAGSNGLSKVFWYENLGGGNFSNFQYVAFLPTAPGISDISCNDINNDGKMDVVVATYNRNIIAWYENLGAGSFGPEQVISNQVLGIRDADVKDMDNDGDLDIITCSFNDDKVSLFENLGSGIFGAQQIISTAGDGPYSLYISDFNNDGNNDVIVGSTSDQEISLYKNLGGLSFGSQQIIGTGVYLYDIYSDDIDGDNDNDIIFSDNNVGLDISVIENLGNMNFSSPYVLFDLDDEPVITNSGGPRDFNAIDIDGDGDLEIFAALFEDDNLIWFENYINFPIQVKGNIFIDNNQNGILDTNELGMNQIGVSTSPSNNFSFVYPNGGYFVNFDNLLQNYQLTTNNISNWSLTTDSSVYNIDVDSTLFFKDSLDFGFYPNTLVNENECDLVGGFPRCNSVVNYWLNVKNIGTTVHDGVIKLVLDNQLSFISSSVAPDSIMGQSFYWSYDSLYYFSSRQIQVAVQMPSFVSIGNTLTSTLTGIILDSLGNNVYSNNDTLEQVLVCAYDPNDKISDPVGYDSLGYIDINTQFIEYTVRFQNTGNDTAITIIVKDQLDANLKWNTLNILSSSHSMDLTLYPNGKVSFIFNNIMLPDSGASEIESHGYLKYRVYIKPNLPTGTRISNKAEIYFDQNPPIITNTKINTLYKCGSLIMSGLSSNISCFGDSIKLNLIGNLPGSIYNWDISNVFNSTTSFFTWEADTVGLHTLTISVDNPICHKDSLLNLIINNIYFDSTSYNICQGDSMLIYGTYQSTAGIFYDSLQTIFGCDSVLSTTLSLNSLPTVSISSFNPDTLCDNNGLVPLPIVSPIGGNYSGLGVSGGNFDPLTSGLGTHSIIYTYTDTNNCMNSDSTLVTVTICVGVDEVVNDFGILIYPNPNTGLFTIEKPIGLNEEVKVKLLDASAKLVLDKIIPIGKQKIDVDITNYSQGIYYLQLIVDDKVYLKQIMKY